MLAPRQFYVLAAHLSENQQKGFSATLKRDRYIKHETLSRQGDGSDKIRITGGIVRRGAIPFEKSSTEFREGQHRTATCMCRLHAHAITTPLDDGVVCSRRVHANVAGPPSRRPVRVFE